MTSPPQTNPHSKPTSPPNSNPPSRPPKKGTQTRNLNNNPPQSHSHVHNRQNGRHSPPLKLPLLHRPPPLNPNLQHNKPPRKLLPKVLPLPRPDMAPAKLRRRGPPALGLQVVYCSRRRRGR